MVARPTIVIAALAALAGCAATPLHPIPVAVLVDGDLPAASPLPKTAVAGLELRPIALPAPAAAVADDDAAIITRARKAYGQGDLDACRADLARVDVTKLLAAGDRGLASRALTFTAACASSALAKTEAATAADRFASFGLELPDSVVSPDVEQLIGNAIARAGAAKRHPLAVTGEIGARLSIDGRPAGCALPCTIDLGPGDHVVAVDADGFQPAVRTLRIPDVATIAVAQQPASPELAARQWRARLGHGFPGADLVGAALIGRFAGERRVAFVHAGASLTGALVVDGKSLASAERDRGDPAGLVRELAYDGKILHRPAVWQRPWFWIAVSGAAVVLAGGIVAVTYQRPIHTSVGF
jgi:hypothetical protein